MWAAVYKYTELVLYTLGHPQLVEVDRKRSDVVVVLRTHRETSGGVNDRLLAVKVAAR